MQFSLNYTKILLYINMLKTNRDLRAPAGVEPVTRVKNSGKHTTVLYWQLIWKGKIRFVYEVSDQFENPFKWELKKSVRGWDESLEKQKDN